MACTLDGLTATEDMTPAVFEAKHVNAFAKIEEVEQKYMPQLAHNMAVCGVSRAILSVFIGTLTWAHIEVALDDWYLAELIDRELAFWEAVERKEPPPFLTAVSAPVPQSKWRTVDMSGSNAWASNAVDWLNNRTAAKTFDLATKELKCLIESDVGIASGNGIEVRRSKAGALSVKEAK
jgi:predicted phage-related endonuclease